MQTRRHIPVASGLLLLLLIVVAVLWVRSPRHAEILGVFSPAGHLQAVATDHLGLLFVGSDLPFGREYGLTSELLSVSRDDFARVHNMLFDKPHEKGHFLGFRFAAGKLGLSKRLTCHYSATIVPYWFVLLALVPLPVRALRLGWVTWRWKRKGLCPGCGYDIRASGGRCPECGREISAQTGRDAPTFPRADPESSAGSRTSKVRTYRKSVLILLALTWCGIVAALIHRHNVRTSHALEFEAAHAGLYHVIPKIDLQDVPLVEAIDQIAKEGNVNIEVRWGSLGGWPVTARDPVTLTMEGYTVERVLDVLARACSPDVSYEPLGRQIVVADRNDFGLILRVYDLREMLPATTQSMLPSSSVMRQQAVVANQLTPVPPHSFPLTREDIFGSVAQDLQVPYLEGSGFRLVGAEPPVGAELGGRLVVIGTRRDHRQIAEFLSLIRPMYRELTVRAEASPGAKP